MERNNSEAGEVLAVLFILTEMPNGSLEFGDRIIANKKDDVISFFSNNDNKQLSIDICVPDLVNIRDSLKSELLTKKAIRGKMEYNSINRFGNLLGEDDCLVAPAGQLDDFIVNGRKICFKASIQNKAGILHYSKAFGFSFELQNISDSQAKQYQKDLKNKVVAPSALLKKLIQNNQITIVDNAFTAKKTDEITFYDFLKSLDKKLPYIYQKLKYRQIELGKHNPQDLLDEKELLVFKKFVDVINHGLTTNNFVDFHPINMDIIIMTRQLNMIYHSLDKPEDIEWMMRHLYIDSGDASRTGSGRIYQENGIWKMSADIYFKFDYHAN